MSRVPRADDERGTNVGATTAGRWRGFSAGLVLPDRAFGAAIDVDGLLIDPDLHFAATPTMSRLMLMPRAGTFSRLLLEWETLPEIGEFTAAVFPAGAPSPFDAREIARLETWMRDVASMLHANRDRIRESAERCVRDASAGLDRSLPGALPDRAHVVSAVVGTRVDGPSVGSLFGVVDVLPETESPERDTVVFVERSTGRRLGHRVTDRRGDQVIDVRLVVDGSDPRPGRDELATWFDQHIEREVLFDDVWQVYVHLLAGLEAPASVGYFGV